MRTARLASMLFLVAGSAWAQPIFSRQGDGQIRNLTLSGGVFGNPMASSSQALSPTIKCAGNAGTDATATATGLAYGTVCVHVTPPTDAVGPLQTYAAQFGVSVPAQQSQQSLSARDAVGLYAEGRFGAFGPAGWAENPLAQANKDASSVIVSEMDLNNLSGCDSPGISSNTTGGSASFVANRSDGSACSPKIGLLVTGVATNTSSAGINFSYVSDGLHAMWQDGIRMLGGYMAAENEWISDTQALTAFKIKGTHAYDGLGLETGRFADAAVSLSAQDARNGRIRWHCPDTGCTAGNGFPTEADLYPGTDGAMHLDGARLVATGLSTGTTTTLATSVSPGTNGLVVGTPPVNPIIMSGVYAPSGWSNNVAEWYLGPTVLMSLSNNGRMVLPNAAGGLSVQGGAAFASLATLQGGASASNYILQGGGSYILDDSSGAAQATIGYDQPNTAIKLSAPGVEISGGERVGGSVTAGTAVLTDTIGPNTSGKVTFSGPVQLPVMTVAQLPSGCTAGEMGYASDGRKTGEAAGAGSGVAVLCTRSGTATVWAPVTTAATAVVN